ncbi:hypothetical protein E2C01_011705 [Portunus trituberculatus]|uniref:Uncharacterized protein n=1 Tax=Portunus trituberculatus TaxID=210409 RepID=A0A5B7DBS7_PORTR|nr:hypothetical protein [Portunus trituberculatus]
MAVHTDVCLFHRSFTSEVAKDIGDTASSGSVPGLNALYTVSKLFPGRSEIACMVEDSQHAWRIHLAPAHSRNPIFKSKLLDPRPIL